MAHIVSCMIDLDGDLNTLKSYIAKQPPSTDSLLSNSSLEERKPYISRMHPPEARKYQLFPKERQQVSPLTALKPLELEAASLQSGDKADKTEKSEKSGGLRLRIKEHTLNRRRKVSVPELGPMTTVQEVAMDSPTIPGRPPLHERSISSPVNSWRHRRPADVAVRNTSNESLELKSATIFDPKKLNMTVAARPMSPKSLAPLVIPPHNSSSPQLVRKMSLNRLRSGSTPAESTLRSSKPDESPRTRTPFTPFTPLLSATSLATPQSSVPPSATIPTPMSAGPDQRGVLHSFEKIGGSFMGLKLQSSTNTDAQPATKIEAELPTRSATALAQTNKTDIDLPPRSATAMSHRTENEHSLRGPMGAHRRNHSDTGSIMERGRPRKRGTDGVAIGLGLRRTASKSSKSAERRAFETLPQGWKPTDATKIMDQAEIITLQQQALGQAARFEVLRKEDVENLSKELRHLDERTEYLRRTYTSLRAGRRNLQSRICQYLRSPRVAKFSYDSMLKQEEALAELDASIDDWVTKLEHAENRRTRVRQKLLEHVAAAATLGSSHDLIGVSESYQQAMGIRAASEISTPPRSPVKLEGASLIPNSPSPSPQRVVARVPSVIPEVPAEELAQGQVDNTAVRKSDGESIRIYADSDVYALLADVENEFTKLSAGASTIPELPETEDLKKELHRARSHELLVGLKPKIVTIEASASTQATSSPVNTSQPGDGEFFLTSAVFQPPAIAASS
ncbi:Up-regulated during septation-domain-containing protein [Xylariales sp. PMI_506]|nr:Up-regulated during septation-domain-containing protein [Xylariales sp. PMI_506]